MLQMLIALAYSDDGGVIGAAPACDYHAIGPRYWQDIGGLFFPPTYGAIETATVEIRDSQCERRLLNGLFQTPAEAADAVDLYLFKQEFTETSQPDCR